MTTPQLSAWQSFYVIIGSSGGALIGLQFVVITLIATMRTRATGDTVSAFGTPTVVHLTAALVVAAIMSAPWPALHPATGTLVACGGAGLVYCALVIRRARRQTGYEPVWEDWLWYVVVPCLLYAGLTLSALLVLVDVAALDGVAAAALGLLLIGIRNAWDTVTHLVVGGSRPDASNEPGRRG